MKICYVDEAGCCGALPLSTSDIQPVLAITGVIIDVQNLREATLELLHLKHRFYPGASPATTTYLGRILGEVKGADLRRDLCAGRRKRRTAGGFLQGVLALCEKADVRIVGRVWIKAPGRAFKGQSVYAVTLADIARHFQDYLERTNDVGVIVADSRSAALNSQMSHSIFTRKFKSGGDDYDRIIDLPTFGHSDNHAGLQIADLLASAILFPVAAYSYCRGHIQSIHIRAGYDHVKADYITRVRRLQHRYQEANGRWRGGLTVSDAIAARSTSVLFDIPPPQIVTLHEAARLLPLFRGSTAA